MQGEKLIVADEVAGAVREWNGTVRTTSEVNIP